LAFPTTVPSKKRCVKLSQCGYTRQENLFSCWVIWDYCQQVFYQNVRNGFLKTFLRYVIVGLSVNVSAYLIYILITSLWDQPKVVMTILYLIGVSSSFYFNRRWAFGHTGSSRVAIFKYIVTHLAGYILNLSLMIFFVDHLGYPHQLIQAMGFVIVALFVFVTFNFFVFPKQSVFSRKM